MGASQSKTLSSPPPPAASTGGGNAAPLASRTAPDAAAPASDPSPPPVSSESKGGECPMKISDGTYRIVPGFASLFGGGGHPPVDANEIDGAAALNPAPAVDPPAGDAATGGDAGGGGCPVKHDGAAGSWNLLRRRGRGSGPGSDDSTAQGGSSLPCRQQYDVYSRPLPVDPANNTPLPNPSAQARNSLPSPDQSSPLPTGRAPSTIPKGGSGDGTTWTYPSPQMFYNALARKGKLGDADEGDMESVVAIHNCMNEGTWGRVLQWEGVLRPPPREDGEDGSRDAVPGPSLTKFMGRPTDLSPKAFLKHYMLGHPLPFDRHDWTVTRTNPDGSTEDVRYVIDYYHDDSAANEDEGSGMPEMDGGIGQGPDSKLKSLLVDVRPAADNVSEVWGRLVTMPLARRGCRSILECVLFKGRGSGKKSDFEPLPLSPSEGLKSSLAESQQVWENIQKDAAMKKGVGAKDKACASDSLSEVGVSATAGDVASAAELGREVIGRDAVAAAEPEVEQATITKAEAAELAASFSKILSSCNENKAALRTCASEEECRRAFAGMTVCAGQFLCPLQHASLVTSLEEHGSGGDAEAAEARVDTAFDVLGDCVARRDQRASEARRRFPEAFDGALGEGG